MNKYRSPGVCLNGRNPFRVIVLKTFSSGTVVEDELWALIHLTYISPRTINTRNAALFGNFEERFSFIISPPKCRNLEKDGVTPDVRAEEGFVYRLKGNQKQLNHAIELILKQLQ